MSLVRPQLLRVCAALFAAWVTLAAPLGAEEPTATSVGITAVPEPSVVLTLIGGAAVLVALQRRRRW